jgi:alpha-methylacyl-CoA racemase
MLLAIGVLAALVERQRSGLGQVVDAAMVDGSALLTSFIYGLRARGGWRDERGVNLLDGGAPFYDTYATADGKFVAVGALEPQFYAALLTGLGLTDAGLPAQLEVAGWPVLRAKFTEVFAQRTRDEWTKVFAGTDACVAPVLSPAEVASHPHNVARGTFTDVGGISQPAPAPRFGRSPAGQPAPPRRPGADTDEVLGAGGLGLRPAEIADLRARGAVA